jgi:hypothetical protein
MGTNRKKNHLRKKFIDGKSPMTMDLEEYYLTYVDAQVTYLYPISI